MCLKLIIDLNYKTQQTVIKYVFTIIKHTQHYLMTCCCNKVVETCNNKYELKVANKTMS